MSTADELQKYKELLDSGAISQEEFDKKKEELLGEKKSDDSNPVFSKYVTDIVAYIGWIGFLLSLCLGTRKESAFHLNQALIINLFALLTCIPFIGSLWAIFMLLEKSTVRAITAMLSTAVLIIRNALIPFSTATVIPPAKRLAPPKSAFFLSPGLFSLPS
jgi:ABC-type transport system involved in multi-copper enzyme maturation permease subunit